MQSACLLVSVRQVREAPSSYPLLRPQPWHQGGQAMWPKSSTCWPSSSSFLSSLSPPFCCLFFIFLTFYFILGVQPSNNVMITAGTQQSDSAIHDMYPLSSKFPSYPDSLSSTHCHITLSRVSSVYIFLQTRHTDGQEAHEKMFNIANY